MAAYTEAHAPAEPAGHAAARRWMLAWLGGPIIGIANGVAREVVYADRLGDRAAHQVSTATAVSLFALYFWLLTKRWPLPSTRRAIQVGGAWVALTVGFEVVFGHWVDGKSFSELAADYDLTAGRLWPLLLAWLALGPAVLHRLSTERSS